MEILFFIIALLLSLLIIYLITRSILSHKETKDFFKSGEIIFAYYSFMGIMLTVFIFLVFMTLNSVFWKMPYLILENHG